MKLELFNPKALVSFTFLTLLVTGSFSCGKDFTSDYVSNEKANEREHRDLQEIDYDQIAGDFKSTASVTFPSDGSSWVVKIHFETRNVPTSGTIIAQPTIFATFTFQSKDEKVSSGKAEEVKLPVANGAYDTDSREMTGTISTAAVSPISVRCTFEADLNSGRCDWNSSGDNFSFDIVRVSDQSTAPAKMSKTHF